ncbi:hypothetical protein AB4Z21_38650, partial [Paenibacillus sp. MCAF20]
PNSTDFFGINHTPTNIAHYLEGVVSHGRAGSNPVYRTILIQTQSLLKQQGFFSYFKGVS